MLWLSGCDDVRMEKKLGCSKEVKSKQIQATRTCIEAYARRISDKHGAKLESFQTQRTCRNAQDIVSIHCDGNANFNRQDNVEVAEIVGFLMTDEQLIFKNKAPRI